MTRVNGGRDGMMMGPVLSGSSSGRRAALSLPGGFRHAFVTAMVDEEAAIFARYLLRGPAPADVLRRYRDAVERLFPDPASPRDRGLLGFATRHPWSVGPLDAAAALLAPKSRLRQH